MPRGGKREGAGAPGAWQHGKTQTIRVPVALADQLLTIARQLDQGQPIAPDISRVAQLLRQALPLPANRGGAIKEKVRLALELLQSEQVQ